VRARQSACCATCSIAVVSLATASPSKTYGARNEPRQHFSRVRAPPPRQPCP
jgi:hypothetical protein